MVDDQVIDVVNQQKNRATELIEDFMVAANGVVARMLEKVSSLRRIVRTPERWDRIVQLAAASRRKTSRRSPIPKRSTISCCERKAADPDHFADLSLAVIKLIGPGEYVLERAGEVAPGHFGLAVQDYTHSTAPNRRFVDIVTQRLLKALLAGQKNPYSDDELTAIAANCTEKEDAAKKVEREMSKRLAAVAMQNRIGEVFDAIVTGVTRQRNVRARYAASAGGIAGARCAGTRCRRQAPRQAHSHRRATRIHRLRARLDCSGAPFGVPHFSRVFCASGGDDAAHLAPTSLPVTTPANSRLPIHRLSSCSRLCGKLWGLFVIALSKWRYFVCLLLLAILPASLLARTTAAAMLRSEGVGVLVNQYPAPASIALFPDDSDRNSEGGRRPHRSQRIRPPTSMPRPWSSLKATNWFSITAACQSTPLVE